jgi:hypothetical protein
MKTKPMRIKAFWSMYGPRVHRSGRNLDCGSDDRGDSWNGAAYWLLRLLEREGYTGPIEFYGPSAEFLKKEFESYQAIK